MNKLIKKYNAIGLVKGAKVEGLVAQSLISIYAPLNEGAEEIVSIAPLPDNEDMVVVKTKELNARTTILTTAGEVPLPAAQRQYVLSGMENLRVISNDSPTDLTCSEIGNDVVFPVTFKNRNIDTDFSTLPLELITTLSPFINYIVSNKEDLDEVLDISTIGLTIDGVVYNTDTLSSLIKIE